VQHLIHVSRMVLLASFFLMVSGCTSFPSKNQDSQKDNKATYSNDLKECKEDHPETAAGLHFNRWADCMNLKGWR
jgi:hypothetical protein